MFIKPSNNMMEKVFSILFPVISCPVPCCPVPCCPLFVLKNTENNIINCTAKNKVDN